MDDDIREGIQEARSNIDSAMWSLENAIDVRAVESLVSAVRMNLETIETYVRIQKMRDKP